MTNSVATQDRQSAEIDRLRAEVETLRGERNAKTKTVWSWVLLGFGVLITLVASVAFFVDQTLLDTDEYVAAVTDLAKEPEIVQAATAAAVDDLIDKESVTRAISDALPQDLAFAASPLVSGLESGIQEVAVDVAGTAEFSTIWAEANRLAHQEAIAVLRGEGTEPLVIKDGEVTLDLSDLARAITAELPADLSSMLPTNDVSGQVTLFKDDQLGVAQQAVSALDDGAILLPLAAVLVVGLGWWLATDRRRFLIVAGIAVAGGLVLLVGLTDVARTEVIGSVDDSFRAAAESTWSVFAGRYATQAILVGVVALLVSATAWLTDPTRRPQGTDSPAVAWIANNNRAVIGGVVAASIFTILIWPHPTVAVVLVVFVIGAVLVAGTRVATDIERSRR